MKLNHIGVSGAMSEQRHATTTEAMSEPAIQTAGAARTAEAPAPEWVRGVCPLCHGPLVSNEYYVGGRGYLVIWECWESLGPAETRTCTYRRVL